MSRAVRDWSDPRALRTGQYRDGRHLEARLALHRRFATNPLGFHAWVAAQLPLDGARVVEVGAGTGALWAASPTSFARVARLVLSDLSTGMLRDARGAVPAAAGGPRFATGDAMVLPFRDGAFDGAVANHMLYHVPDRARAIAELRRVLAPGGWLAAATNGAAHLDELESLLETSGVPGAAAGRRTIEPFSVENGASQLAARFRDVRLLRYEDALAVTEVEPVLAYVRSMTRLEADVAERIGREVARAIERHGVFAIRKDVGLFLARA